MSGHWITLRKHHKTYLSSEKDYISPLIGVIFVALILILPFVMATFLGK